MSEATPEAVETPTPTEPKSFNQDEVNALLAKQKREQFGDYGDLKKKASQFDELEEQGKTEQQRATEALTAAEQRAITAETQALRLTVAAEKGLNAAQIKRLVGTTREELEADADDLKANFPAPETAPAPAINLDLGARGSTTTSSASGDPAADFAAFMKRL